MSLTCSQVEQKLTFIAQAFSRGERGEDVAIEMGLSAAWLSLFIKKYAPELGGKNSFARQQAAIEWLDGGRDKRHKFARLEQEPTCKAYLHLERRICGEILLNPERKTCRSCWEKTIPKSYSRLLSALEYSDYIKTYYKRNNHAEVC